jgi:hypothetical protein
MRSEVPKTLSPKSAELSGRKTMTKDDAIALRRIWEESGDFQGWDGWADFAKRSPDIAKTILEMMRMLDNANTLLSAYVEEVCDHAERN